MKLHEKTKLQEKIIAAYGEGIKDLKIYLSSSKFYHPNNNVNTADIFLRLNELNDQINNIEFEHLFNNIICKKVNCYEN